MRTIVIVAVLSVVGLAASSQGATALLENWNGPGATGGTWGGTVDQDWLAVGGTAHATYAVPGALTGPDGSACQEFVLGNAKNDPDTAAQYHRKVYNPGGFPTMTNLAQWVTDVTGSAPQEGAGRVTVDVRIEVTGSLSDFEFIGFDMQNFDGWGSKKLDGTGPVNMWQNILWVQNSDPGKINGTTGVWYDDYEVLTFNQFPAQCLFNPNLFWKVDPNNPFAEPGALKWYIDDLKIEYVPEPASLMLLSLGGLFLRRRR